MYLKYTPVLGFGFLRRSTFGTPNRCIHAVVRAMLSCTYCQDGMYVCFRLVAPTVGAGAKNSHEKITIFRDAHETAGAPSFGMKRLPFIAVFALVGLVTACGFQLRGVSNLPPELTQLRLIDDGLNADQIRQLSDMLVKAGAKLQNSDVNDPVQLKVKITRLAERELADSAGTVNTIVKISKRLSYSVKQPADVTPLQIKVIERQINIEQDSNNLLGTGSEKETAERTLEQTLFGQLIFQLKRL
jgi:LPS-assembly lipoprotein